MEVLHIGSKEVDQVINENSTVLVDFWAPWCGPCRLLGPVLEEIAAENDDIVVAKVNVDEEGDLANRFQIMSIPALMVFKGGKLVNQSVGYQPKAQVLKLVK